MNYAVNPTNYQQSVRTALQAIMKLQDSEDVILRVAESGDPIVIQSDLRIKPTATHRDYEDSEVGFEAIPFQGENPQQQACVELLKAGVDVDISLPMGYIIGENPLGNTDPEKMEMDCVLTPQDLYRYLASLNASPIYDGEIGGWKGIEQTVNDRTVQSSMVFTATYRYLSMDKENAIAYLESILKGGDLKPVVRSTTDQLKSKLYVIPLPPCVISIIKDSPLYTAPVSKQRLLYIFDNIHAWLQSHTTKWIEMRFNTMPLNPREKLVCFQYKIEKMVDGWTKLPEPKADPSGAIKDISTSFTYQWHLFAEAGHDVKKKLQAVISFLFDYGIDMSLDSYTGPLEDYVENRKNFSLPVRQTLAPVIVAVQPHPSMQYRGRGRGVRGGYRGGSDNGPDHNGGRGRGVSERGFGRGGRGSYDRGGSYNRGADRGGRGSYIRGADRGRGSAEHGLGRGAERGRGAMRARGGASSGSDSPLIPSPRSREDMTSSHTSQRGGTARPATAGEPNIVGSESRGRGRGRGHNVTAESDATRGRGHNANVESERGRGRGSEQSTRGGAALGSRARPIRGTQ